MAAEPSAPWSRWDAPGFQYISHNTQPPIRQFDTGTYVTNNASVNTNFNNLNTYDAPENPNLRYDSYRLNAHDPLYVDCIYSLANSAEQVIFQCLNDYGCCAHKCCDTSDWYAKRGWAIALIVIFGILVIFAVGIWFIVWLLNRSRDKKQRELIETNNSPTPSQMDGMNGYPPYGNSPPPMGPPSMGPPSMGPSPPGMYHQSYAAASHFQKY